MATERIKTILISVYGKVQRLLEVDRFYVALYDPVKAELEFPLVVDDGNVIETEQSPWIPRPYQGHVLLPDRAIEQKAPLLFEHDLRKRLKDEGIEYWPDDESPLSWMGVPMTVEGRVIGALVVENRRKAGAFGESGVRVLPTIARQTALTVENIRLHERLDRKIANLRAVNEVGRQLTSGIRMSEQKILDLIYDQATPLMDTSDMYIALYEPDPSQSDEYNEEQPEKSIIHGTVRFGLAMDNKRQVDTEHETGWGTRPADEKPGLTEYVIRTRRAHRPADVKKAYDTYATEHIGKIPKSWMGVPMMTPDKVLGVVVLRNDEYENVYTEDDEEVLQAIAGQAAIAIKNAELYRETLDLRSRLIKAERLLVESKFAANYIHRVNNLVGTIPIRVSQIEEKLVNMPDVLQMLNPYLAGITDDARRVNPITSELYELSRQEPKKELVDVTDALARIARRVRIETPVEIRLDENYPEESLWMWAIAWELSDAFSNVLKNAVQAMEEGGLLSISVTRDLDKKGHKCSKIRIHNTGPKIPPEILNNIFEPFHSTKEGGTGFGLWRTRLVIEDFGGSVGIRNDDNDLPYGVVVTIHLPLEGSVA